MTLYFVDVGEKTFQVEIVGDEVRVDGETVEAELMRVDGTPVWSLLLEGRSHRVVANAAGAGQWALRVGGASHSARVVDERTRHIQEISGGDEGPKGPAPVTAPMPGLVVRIEVAVGDVVQAGQGMVIVEAMKMENELKSEGEARVVRVHVTEGQAVEKDELLIDLEPLEHEGEA